MAPPCRRSRLTGVCAPFLTTSGRASTTVVSDVVQGTAGVETELGDAGAASLASVVLRLHRRLCFIADRRPFLCSATCRPPVLRSATRSKVAPFLPPKPTLCICVCVSPLFGSRGCLPTAVTTTSTASAVTVLPLAGSCYFFTGSSPLGATPRRGCGSSSTGAERDDPTSLRADLTLDAGGCGSSLEIDARSLPAVVAPLRPPPPVATPPLCRCVLARHPPHRSGATLSFRFGAASATSRRGLPPLSLVSAVTTAASGAPMVTRGPFSGHRSLALPPAPPLSAILRWQLCCARR